MVHEADPLLYDTLNLDDARTEDALKTKLVEGYLRDSTTMRMRTRSLFEQIQGEVWRSYARDCLIELLNCDIMIHLFKRNPFSYGCALPYYMETVNEVMYMEKILLRLELCPTETACTTAEDLRVMFQNCLDYSNLVNSSNRDLPMYSQKLYTDVVLRYFKRTLASFPQLKIDGSCERTRRTGVPFEVYCRKKDMMRRQILSEYRKDTEETLRPVKKIRVRSIMRFGKTPQERAEYFSKKFEKVKLLGVVRAHRVAQEMDEDGWSE